MSNEASDYRHPRHEEIVRRVCEGMTDSGVAADLHVDRRAVARVRGILGIPPMTNSTSVGDKLDRFAWHIGDEHTGWKGRRGRSGAPVIRHLGREIPAAHVAFERRAGRAPVGMCRADCEVEHCLTPRHLMDDLERRRVREQLRATYGLDPQPWYECPEGHTWEEHGRIEPDLTVYCRACATERARRTREARKEEGTS